MVIEGLHGICEALYFKFSILCHVLGAEHELFDSNSFLHLKEVTWLWNTEIIQYFLCILLKNDYYSKE